MRSSQGPEPSRAAAAELITGSAAVDSIKGGGGSNDCILAGDGNDDIDGGSGSGDVCIGGAGTDTFKNCETQIQ